MQVEQVTEFESECAESLQKALVMFCSKKYILAPSCNLKLTDQSPDYAMVLLTCTNLVFCLKELLIWFSVR